MTLRALSYRGCFTSLQVCRLLAGLLGLGLTCSALAQSDDTFANDRSRVALVLSGGGARGLAHVGVLQVLEQLRVPVDCVVGTSMGALVGGAYAAGVRPQRSRELLAVTDIDALFADLPPRSQIPHRIKRDDYKPLFNIEFGFNGGSVQLPTGASAGYKVELFLRELVGPGASVAGTDFDDLPTPYRAVATDLGTGEMKVFESGDLAKVMRASMSLPAILDPIKIDGRAYVDGGLVRNLPVDVGRALCGDVVIAVNLGTPLRRLEELQSVIGVAGQSINLLTEQNVERSLTELTEADILIEPNLDGFSSSDFAAVEPIIERGIAAAQDKAQALSRFSVDEETYGQWLAARESRVLPAPKIARIEIPESDRFGAEAVERDLEVETGEGFSHDELHDDLARLYGRGDFSYLGYSVFSGDDGGTVLIDAEAKRWGPGYLKFGVEVRTDFESPTQANLAASYRRTWVNSLGAEWRVDGQVGYDSYLGTEFLQPLQVRDGVFLAPFAIARRNYTQFYEEGLRLGQLRVTTVSGGLDLGLTDNIGELRLGPYVKGVRTDPEFGIVSPQLPMVEATQVGFNVVAVADYLDSVSFPSSGWFAGINFRATDEDWGSDDEFGVAQVVLRGVKSFGKNSFTALVEWGERTSGLMPSYERFELGGPGRLSGLFLDQLTGTRYNLGTITSYRRVGEMPTQVGRGVYVGFTVEGGRINDPLMKSPWDWVSAGSVFWGADTILGAISIGYGHSSLGQGTAYLVIGQRF
ncbi:MAG: patatin-like phospholipase family protein [Betaproteobacteria bacterium]|jgi:NTE family protein|nr:MAG: patatin-like phospholipase family protein [Betaproteobacteria bacterium]